MTQRLMLINANLSGDYSSLDIALTVLATQVNKRSEHKALICDLTFHRRDWQRHLNAYLEMYQPTVIGMSLNALHMPYACKVGYFLKPTGIPIIVGGHHASCQELSVAEEPWVDRVIIGDGEDAIDQLLNGGLPPVQERRQGHANDTRYCIRARFPFRQNLDDLPIPDWTLWADLKTYFYFLGGMLYVIGSRGCPHQCTFCLAPEIQRCVKGNYYRQRDPVGFVRELAFQEHYHTVDGLRFFQIFDPVFTLDPDWVDAFCKCYRDQCKLPFSVFARLDQLDERRINSLAKAGCRIIRVGIEHGDERIRNEVLEKNVTDTQVKEAVALCQEAGVGLTGYYILGVPGETHQTIRKTIDLAATLKCSRSVFFVYKPFTEKGAAQVKTFGGEKLDGKADNISFGVAIRPSKELAPWMVQAYQYLAYAKTLPVRLIRTWQRDGLAYPFQLLRYVIRGRRRGLPLKYLLTYFHVYAGRNVYE